MTILQTLPDDARVHGLAEKAATVVQQLHALRTDVTALHTDLQLAMVSEPDTAIDAVLDMAANHFRSMIENANAAIGALTPIVTNARLAPTVLQQFADAEVNIRGAAE